jgi:hypothetical protein
LWQWKSVVVAVVDREHGERAVAGTLGSASTARIETADAALTAWPRTAKTGRAWRARRSHQRASLVVVLAARWSSERVACVRR